MITTRHGRAVRPRRVAAADQQVAAAAARQAQGTHRPRGPGPPALRRPDRPARCSRHRLHRVRPSSAASATRCTPAASPRSRRRSCSSSTAARTPVRSRPTSTPTTWISTSGSPPSCTSSGCSSAAWRRSSRSAGSSATRASDFKHNPEFTSLEVYETYGDYDTMRVLTQEIIQEAAIAVYGEPVARRRDADGKIVEYDLSGDWPVKTICEAVSEALGEEVTADTPRRRRCCAMPSRIGLDLDPDAAWGFVLEEIYGELCESTDHDAGLLHRLPEGERAADPAAPRRPAAGREVGPGHLRRRAGHGVLRADRPARPARAAGLPVAAGRRGRPRGDAGRRGLPAGAGVRDATDGRHGHGHRPAGDEPDRAEHPRHHPVPAGPAHA